MMDTNKIYLYGKIVCLGWLFACLLSSCEKEATTATGTNGLRICLRLPEALTVETKASNELDKITIGNVWVLQYAIDGAFKHKQYLTSVPNAAGNQTIVLTTSGFSNENSRFYVIANAGDGTLTSEFNGTEAQLQALCRETAEGWSQNEYNLVSSGPLDYEQVTETGTGNAILVAPLQRTFARVQVDWKYTGGTGSGSMVINSVKVTNLPKKMAYYVRGGAAAGTAYPATDDIVAETKIVLGTSLEQNTTQNFWMPENLRGMGTGTKFADKNVEDKGPNNGEKNTLAGCTYLELAGEYTYPNATGKIGVKYRIYLGGNLVNDYNIRRGYSYKVTFNISGANTADVRVTITNNKVVVFDDGEVVNNTVEF